MPSIPRQTADEDDLRSHTGGTAKKSNHPEKTDNDGLDFVVTEAHDQDTELIGGFKASDHDTLGVETSADLIQPLAADEDPDSASLADTAGLPIGDSEPPLPPAAHHESTLPQDAILEVSQDPLKAPERSSTLEKLTDEKLRELSERMRGEAPKSEYLTEAEKLDLISSLDRAPASATEPAAASPKPATGFANQPIVPPRKKGVTPPSPHEIELKGTKPPIAKRSRGIAYFAKGYIKIAGEQEIHEGDQLVINEREYVLRRKKIGNKFLVAVGAPITAIIIFTLGTLFSSDADIGSGQIVGIVLDENDQPYLTGASVQFPELGAAYETNGQGFFESERLDAGSYKIEFVLNEQVVATDYATVVDDRITMVALRPEIKEPVSTSRRRTQAVPGPSTATRQPVPSSQSPTPATINQARADRGSGATKAASTPRWAKLTLAANVENAKLSIDGSVVGAGNLTYPRLAPGNHRYLVTKEGFQPTEGSVTLKAGRTARLDVSLTPVPAEPVAQTRPELDFYKTALVALDGGDYSSAVADLTKAVELNPGFADAYLKRAEAHRQERNNEAAHDDFIRAGNVLRSQNNSPKAFAAYDKALKLNSRSVPAFLGRGNLYLAKGEDIAAIADFDMAIRLEKRNMHGYIGLGQARYNQGYFKKAVKHFKDARSIDSKNPLIHQHLMLSYFRTGDSKQVKKSYNKFLKYATDEQVRQMQADSRFAPVLRVASE